MDDKDNKKIVKGFTVHGFEMAGESGNQCYGNCPFCGRENKFYVNQENGLWDCKVCGLSGNQPQFLEKVQKRNAQELKPDMLRLLARDRKLPEKAFSGVGLGSYGNKITFPVREPGGKITDIRIYRLGSRLMGTSGCKTGLWNAQELAGSKPVDPVYLCEGEWDGIALLWLIKHLKKSAVVVAAPGANTFKKEWCRLFDNRRVICLYDNDEPGVDGQMLVKERLTGVAKSIEYIHWPAVFTQGFDVRDFISRRAVRMGKPNSAWQRLHEMIKPVPVREFGALAVTEEVQANGYIKQKSAEKVSPISFQKVLETIKKWLHLNNTDGIEVAVATMLSNKLTGDPLWMFLVATPGGAKTEFISTFQGCPESYFTSSLTPHALISGSGTTGGNDPSLIPKLDGMILLIKDFTTILSKREQERDEIFGILRDAYDGSCSKVFGTGYKKSYVSKFSILSAVTPKIYELAESHQSLGERFLKFCIGDNLDHFSEDAIVERAIMNSQKEDGMRKEMSETMAHFIAWKMQSLEEKDKPIIPPDAMTKLIALARYGARLRGTVARDKFRPEIIYALPSAEVGSRLGKQLAKLAVSMAMIHDRTAVSEHDLRLVKKCMLDTIPQRIEVIVRELYRQKVAGKESVTAKEISKATRFPQTTIVRMLADMNLLKIVERQGITSTKHTWNLSDYTLGLIKTADLYSVKEELERKTMDSIPKPFILPKRVKIRVKVK